jgi:SagB-type dehydrogenase family enzyme
MPHTAQPESVQSSAELVLQYHARTKHQRVHFAAGPATLDWDAQPAPFRSYGCLTQLKLPLLHELTPAERAPMERPFALPAVPGGSSPWTLATLAMLLQTSLGISAWKSLGPERWPLRANPSSGNLHPVEAYVIASGLPFLADGVYHYLPERHALEQRGRWPGRAPSGLYLALSSVMWREAWKYGERAFRYCQLDVGHAVAAIAVSAATLGASVREQAGLAAEELARWLGLDVPDLTITEREEPELLLRVELGLADEPLQLPGSMELAGQPSRIDPQPYGSWPLVERAALATRGRSVSRARPAQPAPVRVLSSERCAAELLLGRRSAQRFDIQHVMPTLQLTALLEAARPLAAAPFDALAAAPALDLVLFVHRVEGLESGLYLFSRCGADGEALRARLQARFGLQPVPAVPDLARLARVDGRELMRFARALHCQQDIASSSCLALAMLAPLQAMVSADPTAYRALHREAGVVGQALYLAAEALGLRGTGIGCYLDDVLHELLGLDDMSQQSLYHFTVGKPLDDPRLSASAAYPEPR